MIKKEEVKMKYRPSLIFCGKCKKEPTYIGMSHSDGDTVRLDYFCTTCNTPLYWETTITRIVSTNAVFIMAQPHPERGVPLSLLEVPSPIAQII